MIKPLGKSGQKRTSSEKNWERASTIKPISSTILNSKQLDALLYAWAQDRNLHSDHFYSSWYWNVLTIAIRQSTEIKDT